MLTPLFAISTPEDGDEFDPVADLAVMAKSIETAFTTSTPPAGSGAIWFGATAPTGWLLCNGQAVSRATYATLFAAIGTYWGAGDGVNTFNVPNFRGRGPMGIDATQTEFDTLAKKGGAKTHALTAAENGGHTHGTSAPILGDNRDGGAAIPASPGSGYGLFVRSAGQVVSGEGKPHNNMHPFLVVNFIIKT